ncbi:DUF3857 and transglutaminase domain-containing protein [Flammeovirga sp. EKP202]|uniref:DUF3857 and transglutaminase domain-containing protein n=1 Tax=Flammeovirga sp. EKP202 TaxID=2770592 RepID=UPI00165EFA41|nr:DUF3857 and transglutaminase domain-containing protein [Flammeovirga sp. EKP202]MBD0403724.1 DUF3857 and transglutaminase domain-containing protein [Flammeovirga sp. EKP202]
MKQLLLLLLLTVYSFFALGQDTIEPKLGVISEEEIKLTHCSFDSAAEAVVLFDVGETKFLDYLDGYSIRTTRHKRIKILNEEGEHYASVSIPFFAKKGKDFEKVKNIEAYTYVIENGRIVDKKEISAENIFTERISEFTMIKKFTFPNVKEGVIIEYKYEHITPYIFKMPDWKFQSKIPTLHSQHRVFMIPFFEYVRLDQRIDEFDYYNVEKGTTTKGYGSLEYKEMIYTSVLKNVEAFKDEAYITSINDYIKKIDFQISKVTYSDLTVEEIITTWEKLITSLYNLEHLGKYLKICKRMAKKMLQEDLKVEGLSDAQKASAIINYMKKNFIWNKVTGFGTYDTPRDVINKKTGDVAALNLLMIALLQEAGIEASPAILSTRDHGKLKMSYPFTSMFNYLLAKVTVGETIFLADATAPLLEVNMIPTRCINEYALILDKSKEVSWLKIGYNIPSVKRTEINISIDEEENIVESDVKVVANFYQGYKYRKLFKDDTEKIEEYFKKSLFNEVSEIKSLNYDNINLPYTISFKGQSGLSRLNNILVIDPFQGLSIKSNLLKQPTREYPVDMLYPKKNQYIIKIKMPEGYGVNHLPDPFYVNNDDFSTYLSFGYDKRNNQIIVNGEYFFKKAVYQPEVYQELKSGLDAIVKNFNLKVAIEKIDN